MSEVSTRLRRAREQSGLRIEDISARTKIKPAFLRGLETGHFEALPGHFFTRAFLKAYAREVGLRPEEVAEAFDRVHGQPSPVELAEIESALASNPRPNPRGRRPIDFSRPGWQMAAAAVLVVAVIAISNKTDSRVSPLTTAAGPVPVGTSGLSEALPAAESPAATDAPDTLTIQIRPAATVWVAATADGATAVYKLLQPGQHVTVTGRETSFRVGDAAAFVYSINGALGKPLGGPGEVREFRITTENFRSYLR